jgi:hypothetical protein
MAAKLEEAMGQMGEKEKAQLLMAQDCARKEAEAQSLAEAASTLSGHAKAEAARKAQEAAQVAAQAAKRRDQAVQDAAAAQAQKQQRELTIDVLTQRCKDAEAELARQSADWRLEKSKLKEDYRKEVDTVRERLWENRTLDQMVKASECKAQAAEAENRRLVQELKALKAKKGRSFDLPIAKASW